MPKPKQFLKNDKKKSKYVAQAPSTADEYLAAGVDFEEAGEKWRGGDAAKSTRFFVRAIDCYDEALKKFPSSFDLAYNKARVQYELTQHPKLLVRLPGTPLDLLNTALDSSRYALALKQDNADVLFNTAQVLTSLVEAVTDSRTPTLVGPLQLLEEALELFQRCLTLQEYQHMESITQSEAMTSDEPDPADLPDAEEGGVPLSSEASSSSSEPPQDDRWATIIEPVTNDTLLDTLLAQLECLTTLCALINTDTGKGLAWIEEYSTPLLKNKVPAYKAGTDRDSEVFLTIGNFIAALADANFRSQRIDVGTYERSLGEAYRGVTDLVQKPEALADKAEALIAYNSSVRVFPEGWQIKDVLESRWKALTAALECLTTASKLPSVDNLAKIHLLRGDVELLRLQLGQPPSNYNIAAKNGAVLVKNAEKFYRGAATIATSTGADKELQEAVIKEALAAGLGGDVQKIRDAIKVEQAAKTVLEDTIEEGLVAIEALVGMGIA